MIVAHLSTSQASDIIVHESFSNDKERNVGRIQQSGFQFPKRLFLETEDERSPKT
jgi:hypothetical protein